MINPGQNKPSRMPGYESAGPEQAKIGIKSVSILILRIEFNFKIPERETTFPPKTLTENELNLLRIS